MGIYNNYEIAMAAMYTTPHYCTSNTTPLKLQRRTLLPLMKTVLGMGFRALAEDEFVLLLLFAGLSQCKGRGDGGGCHSR